MLRSGTSSQCYIFAVLHLRSAPVDRATFQWYIFAVLRHKLSTRSAEVRCVSQQIWSEVSEVCERLMDPQALRVWLLPSRLLFSFFLMSLHLFGSLNCGLGWCILCIIMLASWVAPWIAASSESIYRDPMKSVDAPPDSDVAGTRKNQRPLGDGS